jgi:hypothetical protein
METTVQFKLDQQLFDLASIYAKQKNIPLSELFEKFLKHLVIDNSEEIELEMAIDWFSKQHEKADIDEETILNIVKEVRQEIYEKELSS